MANHDDVRDFLTSRRANVSPAEAGVPVFSDDRRVPGLRREEVAMLAGVSPDYYTRLERGGVTGASDSVLNAIARALHLTDVERAHLFDLARQRPSTPLTQPPHPAAIVRPSVQRVLDATMVPAVVNNPLQDLLASNVAGRALFAPVFESEKPNLARFIFLDSRAREFFDDWDLACSLNAAMLRFEAGRDPLNEDMTALIGELSTRSVHFREHWSHRDVHEHRTGSKLYHHPYVGDIELTFDVFELPGEPGLTMCTYSADINSANADKLTLLSSWAADEHTL